MAHCADAIEMGQRAKKPITADAITLNKSAAKDELYG